MKSEQTSPAEKLIATLIRGAAVQIRDNAHTPEEEKAAQEWVKRLEEHIKKPKTKVA